MVTCEVIKKLAVISEHNGYTKELRFISWNGRDPKLDLREWKPDGSCIKGMTFTKEEGMILTKALNDFYNEGDNETDENGKNDDKEEHVYSGFPEFNDQPF